MDGRVGRPTGKTAWRRANPGRDRARARRRPGARPRRPESPSHARPRRPRSRSCPSPSSGPRSAGRSRTAPRSRACRAARPAPHKAALLSQNIYERDLDKTPANYAPLTPLQFIERSASVYPDHLALVHGARRQSWAETYARCRQLASALEKVGIGVGDTVAIMAPNIPEMYEAHFGVPMSGGVLNSLNTRLDAAMIAFILDHSETKVLLVDREYHSVVTEALAHRQGPAAGGRYRRSAVRRPRPDRRHDLRGIPRHRRCRLRLGLSRRRMERDLAQLHVGHHRATPRAWSTAIAAPRSRPTATPRNGRSASIRSISGPCRCSTATAGASRGPWRWSPARRSACAAPAPRRSTTRWPSMASRTCAARPSSCSSSSAPRPRSAGRLRARSSS